jgi:hypothetical protein
MTIPQQEGRSLTPRRRVVGFPDLREEMDRIWEAMTAAPLRPLQYLARQTFPAIDVFEKDASLRSELNCPA